MSSLYMDNGATSFPKPQSVAKTINDYLLNIGSSISRGTSAKAYVTESLVYETRMTLASFFGIDDPGNVIFTKNITESLNLLLFGFLNAGDHVIVSSLEHNAVMRPLNALKEKNITYTQVSPDKNGYFSEENLKRALLPQTKLVVMLHGSNVFGTVLDLKTVGLFCKQHGLTFFIDAAQTAGILPVNLKELHADAIAFTGHKSLLGPTGIGGVIMNKKVSNNLRPLIYGGTGSASDQDIQPENLPDKFESGTPNIVGIVGLKAGLDFIIKETVESIHFHEQKLTRTLLENLKTIKALNVLGPDENALRTAVVSFDAPNLDNAIISHKLASEYGISNRCGLHCAPHAHRWGGTFPKGTVRLSLGPFQTLENVKTVSKALKEIVNEYL